MNKTLSNIIIFTAGSAIGSVVTWKLVENKYKKIADDEIKEVKDYYRSNYAKEQPDVPVEEDEGPTVDEYVQFVKNETNYSSGLDISEKGEPVAMDGPYVISPEDFDEKGYDVSSLRYYADGVLVDEAGDIVEDVENVIGSDSLERFGEYEEDSVFVRDDRLEIDYEILLYPGNYSDIKESSPHSVEE